MTTEQSILEEQRWDPVYKLIQKKSALKPEEDVDIDDTKNFVHTAKILVLGAGGLGCEILKDLALSGFRNISVIDMDIKKDQGRAKAVVAAEFVSSRIQGCNITAYVGDLTQPFTLQRYVADSEHQPATYKLDGDLKQHHNEFYSGFDIVISGLDAVAPRRWMNQVLTGFALKGNEFIIPYIDGGSERFAGQVRVMLPTLTSCYDCLLNLIPPPTIYAPCTLASTPRIPEHCIQFIVNNFKDFHDGRFADADIKEDVKWIYERALKRAQERNIEGVTEKLTLGVIKSIIPIVSSTNCIISGLIVHEALKMCINYPVLKNSISFNGNGENGIYTGTQNLFKKPDCLACSEIKTFDVKFPSNATVRDVYEMLQDPGKDFKLKSPGLYTSSAFPIHRKGLIESNINSPIKELVLDSNDVIVRDVALGPEAVNKITIHIIFEE
ncbi:MAG: putative NEDD8-activating enzyme E1 catalytic subunit [Streblomastix strix]|uniref:NEDD8-activating enzyme E1 catalytic subunit n=1 Tax=Streblomastix strix TaxID=222440 RepID=A0A5J4WDJ9_9EUKA|nr:MAG: putative NEDD8-activating enzyme E1 catalytic subunit [Streblomastix strix]